MVTSASPLDPAAVERSQPDYTFDFCGGHLALDFINTVGSRGGDADDHFNTYGDVIAWAEARGVLTTREAARLRRAAARNPAAARTARARAIDLREALYRVFRRRVSGKTPAAEDLAIVNRFVGDTYASAHIAVEQSHLVLQTGLADEALDRPLAPVVRAAVELLTGDEAALVGACADDTCGWLFIDRTRNRTRRWCDMKECGNRSKVRRFRSRTA